MIREYKFYLISDSTELGEEEDIAFPSLLKYTHSPHPQPLSELAERGDKAQLYRGEVKLYLSCLGNAINH